MNSLEQLKTENLTDVKIDIDKAEWLYNKIKGNVQID